jgi:hypothetical protein
VNEKLISGILPLYSEVIAKKFILLGCWVVLGCVGLLGCKYYNSIIAIHGYIYLLSFIIIIIIIITII